MKYETILKLLIIAVLFFILFLIQKKSKRGGIEFLESLITVIGMIATMFFPLPNSEVDPVPPEPIVEKEPEEISDKKENHSSCEYKEVVRNVTEILDVKNAALAEKVNVCTDVIGNEYSDCYITRASKVSEKNPLLYYDGKVIPTMFDTNGKEGNFSGKISPMQGFGEDTFIDVKIYGDDEELFSKRIKQDSGIVDFDVEIPSNCSKVRIIESVPSIDFSFVMFTDMKFTTIEKICN